MSDKKREQVTEILQNNRIKGNSTVAKIYNYVNSQAMGRLYIYKDFENCGTYGNLRSAVKTLCALNVLELVHRGVYMRKDANSCFPEDIQIIKEIGRKNGDTVCPYKEKYIYGTRYLYVHTSGSSRTVTLKSGTVVRFILNTNKNV